MPKNPLSKLYSSPPPSPSNTLPAINALHPIKITDKDDHDDDHICPVCDGDCTCNYDTSTHTHPLPSTSRSNPALLLPSLKIKLTVPQSMLHKSHNTSTSAAQKDRDVFSVPVAVPKRRGRPPKAVAAARQLAARSLADTHAASSLRSSLPLPQNLISGKQKYSKKHLKSTQRAIKGKSKAVVHVSSSDQSDPDDDRQSGRFPTFVSASGLSSRASSSLSSSDDLSAFDDSDASIQAEEEKFILSEIQDRARNRRELLGDEAPKKRDANNAWVIRPRKKSVGPSDAEMDVDTDATVDEDEDDDDDDDEDEDEDENADHAQHDPAAAAAAAAEEDEKRSANGYVGVATGWSEDDDESSFDADLFFANLSDSDRDEREPSCTSGDDGDHSDMEASITTHAPSMPPEFEVTEGWDGQIVFTNGLRDGQGMVDAHFEAHAASLAESSSSPSSEQSDADMDVDTSEDDEGYEQDADQGEGDTTDEELVGEDDLPNERAMSLFNLPFSVSAINPMSTMSPAVSPAPHDRRPFRLLRSLDSLPNPADILSGMVFCDSDEYEDSTKSHTQQPSNGSRGGPGAPRTGHFEHFHGSRQAIIDDLHKNIPSPHPRFRRRKTSSALHQSAISQVEHLLQSPMSACSSSSFHEETAMMSMSPEMANADLVDLNDVLEASFMDPEPSDSPSVSTENEPRKQQLKNFSRWDLISAGAFRHHRVVDGWGSPHHSTPATRTDYGSMMKSSPLSTMLWQNKASNDPQKRSRKKSVVISPVILPVHDRDGDRTPTNTPPHNLPPPIHNHRQDQYHHRSRKELRRERKLKRKSYGPVHHQHQNHQHHNHHHHPNLKSRSTSSLQRTNFFSSSVPPLNL